MYTIWTETYYLVARAVRNTRNKNITRSAGQEQLCTIQGLCGQSHLQCIPDNLERNTSQHIFKYGVVPDYAHASVADGVIMVLNYDSQDDVQSHWGIILSLWSRGTLRKIDGLTCGRRHNGSYILKVWICTRRRMVVNKVCRVLSGHLQVNVRAISVSLLRQSVQGCNLQCAKLIQTQYLPVSKKAEPVSNRQATATAIRLCRTRLVLYIMQRHQFTIPSRVICMAIDAKPSSG